MRVSELVSISNNLGKNVPRRSNCSLPSASLLTATFSFSLYVIHHLLDSPQLSTLVNTNNAPLPFQATQLKSLIADLSLKTSQVKDGIDLLKWATESSEEHASHLRAITRDYERALSPIRRLPAEILIEIFCWTCADCNTYNPYHLSGFNVTEINQGPWLLG